MSLPWRFVFTGEGPGARFCERDSAHTKEANPFSSGTDVNPFSTASSDAKVSSDMQADASASSWIDLLTGEIRRADSISEPVVNTITPDGSDLLDFLDDPFNQQANGGSNDVKVISSQGHSEDGAQQYINCFKLLAGSQRVCHWISAVDFSRVDILS